MAARATRRLLAAMTAALVLFALAGPPAAREAAAQPAVRVYILAGGDPPSDQAVAQALRARGFSVTSGVPTHTFDGTQAELTAYDVVVVLYTANWMQPLTAGGLAALRAYVEGGGSLVTGEWFGWRGQLQELMPAVNCGWNTAATTTYTQVAPNSALNAGLPLAFSFSLGSFAGSESCLEARPEAMVLYGSSNGGGGGGVGLASWNVGPGRVTAFSTLLGATELAGAEYRTLFQNTVAWAANVRDATPPTVRSVDLAEAGGMVRERTVTLQIKAADRGGSGVGSFIVAEYAFDETAPGDTWRLASTSGWQRYRQPGATYSLTLSPTPGVHYLHVYAADRAGNLSREPVVVFVNYQPAGPTPIGLDEAHLYRVALPRAPAATARMVASAGNPDLYVKGPGVTLTPQSDAPVEELTFAATAGVYELGVIGYAAGSAYTLAYGPGPLPPLAFTGEPGPLKRGRGSVINAIPSEPAGDPGDLPAPPVDTSAPAPEPAVYLPALVK